RTLPTSMWVVLGGSTPTSCRRRSHNSLLNPFNTCFLPKFHIQLYRTRHDARERCWVQVCETVARGMRASSPQGRVHGVSHTPVPNTSYHDTLNTIFQMIVSRVMT